MDRRGYWPDGANPKKVRAKRAVHLALGGTKVSFKRCAPDKEAFHGEARLWADGAHGRRCSGTGAVVSMRDAWCGAGSRAVTWPAVEERADFCPWARGR